MSIEWLSVREHETKRPTRDGREVVVSTGSSAAPQQEGEESEFARFEALASKVVRVPKNALDAPERTAP